MRKSWPHVENFGGKEVGRRGQGDWIKGDPCRSGRRPPTATRPVVTDFWSPLIGWPLVGQRSLGAATSGRLLGAAFFLNFFGNLFFLLFKAALRDVCTAPPFFEACPYTWKCWIFHPSWILEILFFFQTLFFLNLEYTWTFIFAIGIFVSWKIEITKNSARFASVMEIFCTLLQCTVDLSMFHLLSTSKIWHTST
jgi:hypothetical protein